MEHKTVDAIDQFAIYNEIFDKVLPELKTDIAKGLTAIDLAKKYSQLAQARMITTALTDADSSRSTAAAKDILDRAHGKATENKKIEHSMAQASDAELDALIESKLRDVTEESNEKKAED